MRQAQTGAVSMDNWLAGTCPCSHTWLWGWWDATNCCDLFFPMQLATFAQRHRGYWSLTCLRSLFSSLTQPPRFYESLSHSYKYILRKVLESTYVEICPQLLCLKFVTILQRLSACRIAQVQFLKCEMKKSQTTTKQGLITISAG